MKELHLTKNDFRVDWYSGSGAGGQHRNKRQNCCRITHLETGLQAIGTEAKDRPTNQKQAFKRLVQKILSYLEQETYDRGYCNVVVRTYHFERGVAKDHGANMEKDLDKVLEGDLDDLILGFRITSMKRPATGRV